MQRINFADAILMQLVEIVFHVNAQEAFNPMIELLLAIALLLIEHTITMIAMDKRGYHYR